MKVLIKGKNNENKKNKKSNGLEEKNKNSEDSKKDEMKGTSNFKRQEEIEAIKEEEKGSKLI